MAAHFVLQGKGGVGKSFIAYLAAQYIQDQERLAGCFDIDQENATFAQYGSLDVKKVKVMDDSRIIDQRQFDGLISEIFEKASGKDVIVDSGANTFSPLLAYLLENEILALLEESEIQAIVHTVVGGGDLFEDTKNALDSLVNTLPPSVKLVIWENEHFGPLRKADGKPFEAKWKEGPTLAGRVLLEKRNHQTFGVDVRNLLASRKTFNEALASPEIPILERQRLKILRDDVYRQLDGVQLWPN
jgi:hypothetical protein